MHFLHLLKNDPSFVENLSDLIEMLSLALPSIPGCFMEVLQLSNKYNIISHVTNLAVRNLKPIKKECKCFCSFRARQKSTVAQPDHGKRARMKSRNIICTTETVSSS